MIDKEGAEHYAWGGMCDGWHLLKGDTLSVIEERIPPGGSEVRHYHEKSRQFFYVLTGVLSFEVDGKTKPAFSIGSSEHFTLPRLRPWAAGAAEATGIAAQAPLTDVGVFLGWLGSATRLVQAGSALATPVGRLPGVRGALRRLPHRPQPSMPERLAGSVRRSAPPR